MLVCGFGAWWFAGFAADASQPWRQMVVSEGWSFQAVYYLAAITLAALSAIIYSRIAWIFLAELRRRSLATTL